MTLTGTDRGAGSVNTGGQQTLTVTRAQMTGDLVAGSLAVLCVAYDNAGSGGSDPYTGVIDTRGNPWSSVQNALNDPGSANSGSTLRILAAVLSTGLSAGDSITVSFGAVNTVARAWTLHELSGSAGPVGYVTGATATATSAAPTITTATVIAGDMVVGVVGAESGTSQTFTGDADSTRGTWSTQQTSKVGTTASGHGITSQRKLVTSDGTQAYNPTLGISSDLCIGWIAVHETVLYEANAVAATGTGTSGATTDLQLWSAITATGIGAGQNASALGSAYTAMLGSAASMLANIVPGFGLSLPKALRALARVATGTGHANNAPILYAPAVIATGAGAAYRADHPEIAPSAGAAAATGAAATATALIQQTVDALAAAGVGLALDGDYIPGAGLAAGIGAAWSGTTVNMLPSTAAAGTGAAYAAVAGVSPSPAVVASTGAAWTAVAQTVPLTNAPGILAAGTGAAQAAAAWLNGYAPAATASGAAASALANVGPSAGAAGTGAAYTGTVTTSPQAWATAYAATAIAAAWGAGPVIGPAPAVIAGTGAANGAASGAGANAVLATGAGVARTGAGHLDAFPLAGQAAGTGTAYAAAALTDVNKIAHAIAAAGTGAAYTSSQWSGGTPPRGQSHHRRPRGQGAHPSPDGVAISR